MDGGKSNFQKQPADFPLAYGFTPTPKFGVSSEEMAERGFTLIELLIVLSIMGIIIGLIVANFAAQRASRDLKIAQSQLVTNLRKIQSNAFLAKTLPGGQQVDFYVMKFNTATPTQYTIQAVYNSSNSPTLQDVETVKFPSGIVLASTVTINRPGLLTPPVYNSSCALVSFKLPYGKIYMNNGCNPSSPSSPYSISTSPPDDYDKIIAFTTNLDNLTVSEDSKMTITLTAQSSAMSKTVTINGVNGLITFQ